MICKSTILRPRPSCANSKPETEPSTLSSSTTSITGLTNTKICMIDAHTKALQKREASSYQGSTFLSERI